eukprot:Hpha_TRINITY_DN36516_c0_g1::TRINITY_DN36516_c0_g1_i1::g.130687::m.130687
MQFAVRAGREDAPEMKMYQELFRQVAAKTTVRALVRKRANRRKSGGGRLFRVLAPSGDLIEVDTSAQATRPWSLRHGMRLRLTEGVQSVGSTDGTHVVTTVIGVAGGQLWRLDDGELCARPFLGSDFVSLMDRHAFVWTGSETPREYDPATTKRPVRRGYKRKGPIGLERVGQEGVLQEFDVSVE